MSPMSAAGGRSASTGQILGTAYRASDIPELLRQAGMENAEDFDLTPGEFVEWRGGGPETWAESPP
ncbi:hypothetical protein [Streptomyces sp. ISL-44]|uniref:hypothetical protein n=1 Tax=Streptomyces sp. ISL-44 TaxID=2819184 RepID=UPI002035B763|nr:hypothetical protein [Streptomyces sp. ISL-44]